MLRAGWPLLAFVERRFADNPTNWWVPNGACVAAMLRTAGLRVLARPGEETWLCAPSAPPAEVRRLVRAELDEATGRR
jgi:tRNA (mo5U34)-methyltransferase